MRVGLHGLGINAPGLMDWDQAGTVLRGEREHAAEPVKAKPPVALSPNERRRTSLATRLALEAAFQALADMALVQQYDLLSVFASSDGDMGLIDLMCREIYEHHSSPSPTVFQNSVHNAVAGYWSIAADCRGPSTSVASGDGSFAAGLLEAATLVVTHSRPCLLVAYDVPAPALLHPHRTFHCPFACALVLEPVRIQTDQPVLVLEVRHPTNSGEETTMADQTLEAMRRGNPAARALPLLAAIAKALPMTVTLPYWPDLALQVILERSR